MVIAGLPSTALALTSRLHLLRLERQRLQRLAERQTRSFLLVFAAVFLATHLPLAYFYRKADQGSPSSLAAHSLPPPLPYSVPQFAFTWRELDSCRCAGWDLD